MWTDHRFLNSSLFHECFYRYCYNSQNFSVIWFEVYLQGWFLEVGWLGSGKMTEVLWTVIKMPSLEGLYENLPVGNRWKWLIGVGGGDGSTQSPFLWCPDGHPSASRGINPSKRGMKRKWVYMHLSVRSFLLMSRQGRGVLQERWDQRAL